MKALLWFWLAVVALVVGGVATLAALGPPSSRPRPAADAGLAEPAPDLPGRTLPRIAPDGRTAATEYAAHAPAADGRPRIAVVLSGIGLAETLSARLIDRLPAAIDLAFSAYTPDATAARLAAAAARIGHECLVSVPMEPAGYPLAEEGPAALAASADAADNSARLRAALSRIPHCVGATGASDGMAGERFAESGPPFTAMLREIRSRGLLYLDPRPDAPATPDSGVLHADLVLDQRSSPSDSVTAALLDSRLAALEALARAHGHAIGLAGPPWPVTIDRLAAWAGGLPNRGFALVPLSGSR